MKEPFYELEIKTGNCIVEVLINDLPIFSNYETGGMAVDYPVNDAILKSGNQNLEIKIFPTTVGTVISKYAQCELNVYVKEANKAASGRNLINKISMIDFKEKNLPTFIHKQSFIADVPYTNEGWLNLIDLKKIDEDIIKKELISILHQLSSIYNSKNEMEYKKIFQKRTSEHNKSFFLTQEEIKDNEDSIFHGIPEKIESIDLGLYKLVFYGNNKLVSLQTHNQPPGFVFESINKDEYGFTELVSFGKETKNSPLIVIR